MLFAKFFQSQLAARWDLSKANDSRLKCTSLGHFWQNYFRFLEVTHRDLRSSYKFVKTVPHEVNFSNLKVFVCHWACKQPFLRTIEKAVSGSWNSSAYQCRNTKRFSKKILTENPLPSSASFNTGCKIPKETQLCSSSFLRERFSATWGTQIRWMGTGSCTTVQQPAAQSQFFKT